MAKVKNYTLKYLKKIIKILSLKELRILPAYLSYSFVLAIIPILTITVIIAGCFSISMDTLINIINNNLPSYASSVVVGAISGKEFDISVGLLNITTFIVAANGMYAIVNASNSLYNIENTSQVKDRLRSILILVVIILLLLFLVLVPMLGEKIILLMGKYRLLNNIVDELLLLYKAVKWPITFLIIFFNIKIIYSIAPSKKIEGSETTLGAFVTTSGWAIFTAIFSYYIKFFAKYDLIYGGLASIIILLIWFYILSFILILGIVVNTAKYNKG